MYIYIYLKVSFNKFIVTVELHSFKNSPRIMVEAPLIQYYVNIKLSHHIIQVQTSALLYAGQSLFFFH